MDQAVHEYEDLETVAREEIMASGGSLSHHHGNLSSWLFVSTSVFPSRFDSFFVGNERCGWKPQQLARGLFFRNARTVAERCRCAGQVCEKNRHFFAQDADEQPNRWRSILIIFFKAIATRGFRV